MGNFDLTIVVNFWYAIIIKGEDYINRREAIQLAVASWDSFFSKIPPLQRDPNLSSDINSIQIYEIKETTNAN